MKLASILLLLCLLVVSEALLLPGAAFRGLVQRKGAESNTALFAHHVQKKVIMKKMHNRPKKHRPSDIDRNNVNLDKCITKVADAPAEYTLMAASDHKPNSFWTSGDSKAPWITITDEDLKLALSQNITPLPEGGVQKRPPLVKSGSC